MADGMKRRIEPFDGTNYESWQFKIDLWLKKKGVYTDIVTRLVAKKDRSDDWEEMNTNAMFIIGTNVSDQYLEVIRGYETAFEMYDALRKSHGRESDSKIVDLRAEMATLKFSFGDDIASFLVKFRAISRRLIDLGDKTSSRQFILSMLRNLPSEFRPIRVVLEEKNPLSWDLVTSRLIDFDKDLKSEKKSTPVSVSAAGSTVSGSEKTEPKSADERAFVSGFGNHRSRRGNFNNRNNYNGRSNFNRSNRCLLYTSPSPRDRTRSRMPSSA